MSTTTGPDGVPTPPAVTRAVLAVDGVRAVYPPRQAAAALDSLAGGVAGAVGLARPVAEVSVIRAEDGTTELAARVAVDRTRPVVATAREVADALLAADPEAVVRISIARVH